MVAEVAVMSGDGVASARLCGMSELTDLAAAIRVFNAERNWGQFHDPKSLLIALVGEVGEVAELLQWLPTSDAATLARAEPLNSRIADELSDVLIYLVQLAAACGVDLAAAAPAKLAAAGRKYPAAEYLDRAPER